MPTKRGAYKPAALPPLLDLSNKNTKSQLGGDVGEADPKKKSADDCRAVMKEHLREWIESDPGEDIIAERTREGDVKAFWLWVRHFHKEYNDDWYTRNMPRLKEQFHPIFIETVKEIRQGPLGSEQQPSTETNNQLRDLLDFGDQEEEDRKPNQPPPRSTTHSSSSSDEKNLRKNRIDRPMDTNSANINLLDI